MESRAVARYVRITPRKVNQVLDLIRGKDVEEAQRILSFTTKRLVRSWIDREPPHSIPWTPLGKPLSVNGAADCATAGIGSVIDFKGVHLDDACGGKVARN